MRVRLSATTEVSNASILPNIANTRALITINCNSLPLKVGTCREGKPEGISPIRRNSKLEKATRERIVPKTKATSCGGTIRFQRLGVRKRIAMVRIPNPNSAGFKVDNNSGRAFKVPIIPPSGPSCPSKGGICKITKMMPIPDINPEITV